jgi:hypothetical protein
MSEYGPPRRTTPEERERMAKAARQHLIVMRHERRHARVKRQRGPRCVVCGQSTEYGCPDCPVTLCNPYQHDCYDTHFASVHS